MSMIPDETSSEKKTCERWYVIQTKPTSEEAVCQHLKNANFETFLPKIQVMVRSSGKSVSRTRVLFPSYVFAHIDLNNANLYHMIKYTRGVRKNSRRW